MGFFSWITADTNKSISNRYSVYGALPVYVVVPKEFGEHIYEVCYEGYGCFGGINIFELVIDMNRQYLSIDLLYEPKRSDWSKEDMWDNHFEFAYKRYEEYCDIIQRIINGASDEELYEEYGENWKIHLGIEVSGTNENNKKLKHPICFVEDVNNIKTLSQNYSLSCNCQGYFYDDDY